MSELKIGMVGLDTSHAVSFTKLLNFPGAPFHVPGGRVTAAFPGGSQAFSMSRDRVPQFTSQFKDEFGVEICDSIESVMKQVDALFLESVDGRQHLEQFRVIAPFGKPVFIDKPFTCSAADAHEIIALSKQHRAPIFSASAMRYAAGVAGIEQGRRVFGCIAFGNMKILPDYPGLYWYGVHSAEVLFSKLGSGCRQVFVQKGEAADAVTGLWEDGRTGVLYGYRVDNVPQQFGCSVLTDGGLVHGIVQAEPPTYALILEKIFDFFKTGKSPVDLQETLEIMAFLEAANRSRESGRPEKLAL
ncbi:MAG TPA: Gfo/Idh/MocA family oxidoreductase [bacterium]|uniref:Gfo/Idh/MocA-like oxidoreductase N-terminal domain-containing protein n=1 Tax=candidate division TA06 bacterium ADurb.Bin417 TaxID=1852828 RepID=A0A1V5MK39_UNCT6|nr:MAG: hypothetical protein BWY73_00398 [candidate division TA06 bacterium ADurb.Bin417]HNQ34575.1 Gfo/Idh/MocA family oxidoreductase [bacterium]HNS48167.1 Gfo/Idh/MocA family oxidoreductase [bacterium]